MSENRRDSGSWRDSKRYAICAGEVRLEPATWCVVQRCTRAFGKWWLPSIHSGTACAGAYEALTLG